MPSSSRCLAGIRRVPVISHTKYDDYTAGEVNLPKLARAVETCPGRWIEREGHTAQYQILTFLGKSWCRGDKPELPDEQIIGFTRQIVAKGGAVTFDVPIQKSGLIRQPFVEQLRSVGRAMAEQEMPATQDHRPALPAAKK